MRLTLSLLPKVEIKHEFAAARGTEPIPFTIETGDVFGPIEPGEEVEKGVSAVALDTVEDDTLLPPDISDDGTDDEDDRLDGSDAVDVVDAVGSVDAAVGVESDKVPDVVLCA